MWIVATSSRGTGEVRVGCIERRGNNVSYTSIHPSRWGDAIELHPSVPAARANASNTSDIDAVAVRLRPDGRSVVPLWTEGAIFDPDWRGRAILAGGGSIVREGPIPWPLIMPLDPDEPAASPIGEFGREVSSWA